MWIQGDTWEGAREQETRILAPVLDCGHVFDHWVPPGQTGGPKPLLSCSTCSQLLIH